MIEGQRLGQFISLVEVDTRIRVIKQKIVHIENEINDLLDQKSAINQELEMQRHAVIHARKKVDEQELLLKALDETERSKKKQLDAVTGYKGYQSLQHELAHMQEERQKQEQLLLAYWHELEIMQNSYEAMSPICEQKTEEIKQKIAQKKEGVRIFEEEIRKEGDSRLKIEKNVPTEWLEKYVFMSGQIEDPVVSVIQGCCGGCFYQLPRQDMINLQNQAIIQCKSCCRLLYIPNAGT